MFKKIIKIFALKNKEQNKWQWLKDQQELYRSWNLQHPVSRVISANRSKAIIKNVINRRLVNA